MTAKRVEYRDVYLRSAHWAGIRKQALKRAEHRCQVCNGTERLDVHHRTYERLGHERPGDLTVLCRRCHDLFHGATGRGQAPDPTSKRSRRRAKHRAAQQRATVKRGSLALAMAEMKARNARATVEAELDRQLDARLERAS